MGKKFDSAFEYLGQNEGGWSDHELDAGGATNFGITIGTLSRWLGRKATIEEVRNLKKSTAKEIYKAWYWDVSRLDEVNSDAIATAVFDIGVVRGVGTSARNAQKVCQNLGIQFLKVDGRIGPASLRALNTVNEESFVLDFAEMAASQFRSIVADKPNQKVFLKGWLNRAQRLKTLVG